MIKSFYSFGKLSAQRTEKTVGGIHYKYLTFVGDNGDEWHDLVSQRGPFDYFLAVDNSGAIISMENDPDATQIAGYDIVGIRVDETFMFTRGPDGNVYGKIWSGQTIVDPPQPTQEEIREQMPPISKRQLRLTLVRNGINLSDLDVAILAMGDEAVIEWQDASEYRRLHPLLNQVAAHLSLTPEQVDAMWHEALIA